MYSCYDIKGDNNMSMNNSNKLSVRDLDLFYGEKQALIKINMDIKLIAIDIDGTLVNSKKRINCWRKSSN